MYAEKKTSDFRKLNIETIISKQIDPEDYTPLNIYELRNYCYYGFSSPKYRPQYWKILLGYYSKNKFKSSVYYKRQRYAYSLYIEDIKNAENPFFKIIENDVVRTFIQPTIINNKERCAFLDATFLNSRLTHRDIITRILKCFVMHSKSVGYIQGMVMILIPIYHVFVTSKNIEDIKYCEEDAFFCFNSLMSELYENFICDMESEESVNRLMKNVWDIVKEIDPELYKACESKKIIESAVCLKWIIFVFSTEYKCDDVKWLWDRLFGDGNKFEMVYYCVAAVFRILKNIIISEPYENIMEVLQNISLLDIETVFNTADGIRLEISKRSIKNKY
jgi:hypothetical protein